MFRFTKSYMDNKGTKIATDYVTKTDTQRIEEIMKRQQGIKFDNNVASNNPKINEPNINKDVYRDRINSMKNIKKD